MRRARTGWVPWVLLGAALVLAFDPWPFSSPLPAWTQPPAWATTLVPVRQPAARPQYAVAGFTYLCSDCHAIIPSPAETHRVLTQHKEIEFNHGINTRCFNCHHRTQRDSFVDDLGREIPWDQPQLVCAKCHGPVYRDWQHGSHGRLNGYWDPARGPQSKRKCIECHDPHTPPFPALKPAPGPNTLRMGHGVSADVAAEPDPLRIRPVSPLNRAP